MRGTIVDKTPSRSKPELGTIRTQTTVTNQDGVDVMRFTFDRADAAAARRPSSAVGRAAIPIAPIAVEIAPIFAEHGSGRRGSANRSGDWSSIAAGPNYQRCGRR